MVDKLTKLKKTHLKEMQRFVVIGGTLYYRSSDGVLARCLDQEEISTQMEEIHNAACGVEGPKLSRRLQRAGYFWLEMEEDAARLQKDCPQSRLEELELIDERREKAQINLLQYQRRVSRAYDKLVRPRTFQEGDMVLKAADHVMRGMHATKFVPNWEGPYVIKEIKGSGYCTLLDTNTGMTLPVTNIKYIKKYFS
ncbi:hypothetical protein G4B88_028286 [Cannabis sativa]|uniref:Uncharacterized protein n=1 Tax=Cannabis sativa TaxID=3483 RepID=A0A7J6EBT5_CANSA|nr:hypothetical protein G4B88_028286 [Cannabis sativa]